MQSPELNLLIFDLAREEKLRKAALVQHLPRTSVLSIIRTSAGNALVTIGSRIAQEPRPASTCLPAGQISMVGRIER